MNNRDKKLAKLLMGLLLILITSGCNLSDIINNTPKVTAVQLNTKSVSLIVGESVTLSAVVYGDPSQEVVWQTSNSKLATVERGLVTALATGEVLITAFSTYDPAKSDVAEVTVLPAKEAKPSNVTQQ